MRGVLWLVLIGALCVGCGKKPALTAPAPPPNADPVPKSPPAAKSMLALDYDVAWKKHAPKGVNPTPKPLHDATTGGKRTIVIAPAGTDDEIAQAWDAFCDSLSGVLLEAGAWGASREEVAREGIPLQRVRYNAPQRQGMVTIGLVRAGTDAKQLTEHFPAAGEPAQSVISGAQPNSVVLVVTIDEK